MTESKSTVQPTLEYRRADSDGEWERIDPAVREDWQWHDSPDWLAAEALWLLGEGCEVRLISTGVDTSERPHLHPEMFGDWSPENGNGATGCLSLNPPEDNPPVPEGATHYGEPVANAGQRNDPGTGAYHHTTDVPRLPERASSQPKPHGMYGGYTTDQLKAAWDLVRPAGDWKGPIDAIAPRGSDVGAIAAACSFFAGSPVDITAADGGWRVTGAGYYACIGS